MSADKRAAM